MLAAPLCNGRALFACRHTQDAGIGPHTRWDFDVFGRQHDELMGVCYDIFDEFNLLQRFDIAPNRLQSGSLLHGLMRTDTAFHNFRHVFRPCMSRTRSLLAQRCMPPFH